MELYKKIKSSPFLIAGPCAMEGEEMAIELAHELKEIASKHGFQYIFKASFDKANRSSIQSFQMSSDGQMISFDVICSTAFCRVNCTFNKRFITIQFICINPLCIR